MGEDGVPETRPEGAISTFAALPPDLIAIILDVIGSGGLYTDETWSSTVARDLRAISLVHRTWTRECQARLSHAVVLPNCDLYPHWRELAETCETSTGLAPIGPTTRAIFIQCECSPQCSHTSDYLAHIAAAAPNLRTLRLTEFGFRKVGPELVQLISGLQSLQFLDCYVNLYETFRQLFGALNGLPRFTTLSLCVRLLESEPPGFIDSLPQRTFRLKSVRLDSTGTIFPFGVLDWLLRPSSLMPEVFVEELKVKSTEIYFNARETLPSFLDHVSHLQRMKVSKWLKVSDGHRIELFSRCAGLHTLQTDLYSRIGYGRVSETALEHLPPSLEVLVLDIRKIGQNVFGNDPGVHTVILAEVASRLTSAIKTRLGKLSQIVFIARDEGTLYQMREIKDLCESKSIRVDLCVGMAQLDDALRW